MPSAKNSVANSLLRNLPSVDEILRSPAGRVLSHSAGEQRAAVMARSVIDGLRADIKQGDIEKQGKEDILKIAAARLAAAWKSEQMAASSRVINATGVVIHTNLGRAPLSDNARKAVAEAAGYCNLEYDLETGKRGRRGGRAEDLLIHLTGAESVLIVNNCAAAAYFVLTVFAALGEVIVSRGELVEIGGDFRVPDILTQSGAKLREVGTTNRTKLADYEKAINEKTRVILRVHPSNYRIVGFTAMPALAALAELAHRHNILIYEDIGSGALTDLSSVGLTDEPVVADSISAGADVVTFSGDKLLGGPQAGIIAGKSEIIERLRNHPLYRALRVDKLTCAALEATLDAHCRNASLRETPVARMLSCTRSEIGERLAGFVERIQEKTGQKSDLKFEILDGFSATGGGAAPETPLETTLLGITHARISASKLEQALRNSSPPVIARIVDERVVLDLRTVSVDEESELLAVLLAMSEPPG